MENTYIHNHQSQFLEWFGDMKYLTSDKTMSDFFDMKAGQSITAENIIATYDLELFPCYGGNGLRGYVTHYTHEGHYCLIGRQGALCGNVNLTDGKFFATEHAIVVTPKISINTYWLFFALSEMNLNRFARGVAQPGLSVKQLETIPFSIPPTEEQEQFERLYRQADKSKFDGFKSQFLEWFGGDKFVSTTLPEISENLDYKRVPITSGDRNVGQFPYYGASGIVDYIDNYIFDEPLLLVSEDGANLKDRVTPIAFIAEGKYWVNNHAHVLKFTNFANMAYICHFFNFTNIEKYLTGMAQPKLNQAQLNTIKIPWPPVKMQEQFAALVEQADKSKYYEINET